MTCRQPGCPLATGPVVLPVPHHLAKKYSRRRLRPAPLPPCVRSSRWTPPCAPATLRSWKKSATWSAASLSA